MKLLLVGNGYLGQAVTRVFREHGWEVVTVSLSGDDGSIACDIGDANSVRKLPAVDFIVHCAASGRGGADAYRHVYVEGCKNLIDSFPGTPLLFTSSTSVYAQTDGSMVTEDSPAVPDRETGSLLLEAERVTRAAGGTVARLAGIYGPGRSVILKKFLAGETVIEEDGRRFLNQIHRDDAARAIFRLAESGLRGEVYNVSDSTPLTQLDCHRALADLFSRPMPPSGPRDLNRKRGWTHKQVANAKLRSLGWEPRHPSFLTAAPEIAGTVLPV
ncbi:MAG: NAD-dependent epimerase/dehydratase family protein [Verrucomicrobiaceae bacterium]|nr:MAG: NAD-dependent epimerase/dehydratase family protein [Verrucomicrobiaceae bacterium]